MTRYLVLAAILMLPASADSSADSNTDSNPATVVNSAPDKVVNISGVYPHLAVTNNLEECGIGALVPWAGKLWAVSYGPHRPAGSIDS